MKKSCLIVLLLIVAPHPVWSQDDRRVVAVFNNFRIHESDVQVSEALAAAIRQELSPVKFQQFEYTYRMELLAREIHSRMLRRILAEENYEVPEAEVSAYLQQTRRLRSDMTEQDLLLIRSAIRQWHFHSILFDRYGGRAVRLPTGQIKPVGAYNALVEQLMAEKVLFFPDITYRACLKILERQFEREDHPEVNELEALEYFLQPAWGPFNERYNRLPIREKVKIKSRLKTLHRITR